MGSVYFVFWSILSAVAIVLVGFGYFHLMQVLKDIKQNLDQINTHLDKNNSNSEKGME